MPRHVTNWPRNPTHWAVAVIGWHCGEFSEESNAQKPGIDPVKAPTQARVPAIFYRQQGRVLYRVRKWKMIFGRDTH